MTRDLSSLTITAPLHTALLVNDLDRSEYFYGTLLGLPTVDRSLSFPGQWYQIGNYQLHLIVAEGFQADVPNPQKWGRNAHIAFGVKDIAKAKAELEAAGVPLQMSASGRAALFARDPDGNIVELSQI